MAKSTGRPSLKGLRARAPKVKMKKPNLGKLKASRTKGGVKLSHQKGTRTRALGLGGATSGRSKSKTGRSTKTSVSSKHLARGAAGAGAVGAVGVGGAAAKKRRDKKKKGGK